MIYLPHLQVFSLWPLFLSVYFFLRFSDESRPIFLLLFFLTTSAQVLESVFPVYLIFFTTIILIFSNRKNPNTRYLIINTFYLLLLFLPFWILFLSPYLSLHTALPEATRPIRDAAHFSLGLEEIFTKFHSWTVIGLFFASLGFLLGRWPARDSSEVKPWVYIFAFSLFLSLGPVVKLFGHTLKIFGLPIPLPYAAFYYLFPGFTGFRTPSRFIVLAAIAGSIIIGNKLQPIFKKFLPQTKFFLIGFFLLLLMLESHLPLPSYPVDATPPSVYQQVQKLPANAIILELPIKLWNDDGHEIESIRSLYSLSHGHRRVGGFSGFAPLAWINLVQLINTSRSNPEVTNQLKSLGVTHIIKDNLLLPL